MFRVKSKKICISIWRFYLLKNVQRLIGVNDASLFIAVSNLGRDKGHVSTSARQCCRMRQALMLVRGASVVAVRADANEKARIP
jgi:hypothetical protein